MFCSHYYKWNRVGKTGNGSYGLEIVFEYSDKSRIAEVRDLQGNVLKPIHTECIDVDIKANHVFYTHVAIFNISENFLKSITGATKYRLYTGIGYTHDFTLQKTHIQGFLIAVNAKRN